ncbi:MAG: hypothetical protein ACP5H2_02785 [Solirubrobacteraceae bacterium]
MTTKITQETKGEAHVRSPVGVVARDMGLDHDAGDLALHPVGRAVGRMLRLVRRAGRKKS